MNFGISKSEDFIEDGGINQQFDGNIIMWWYGSAIPCSFMRSQLELWIENFQTTWLKKKEKHAIWWGMRSSVLIEMVVLLSFRLKQSETLYLFVWEHGSTTSGFWPYTSSTCKRFLLLTWASLLSSRFKVFHSSKSWKLKAV